MSRYATQPLDSDACAAADDEIYARHANDPRPNALYDANGNRLPLDPNDPSQEALRSEWMDLYEAYGGDVAYDPPSSAPDDSLSDEEDEVSVMPVSTNGPVEECPYEEALESDEYQYAVWVTVVTRIGHVPVRGVKVIMDGEDLGPTNNKGESTASKFRTNPAFTLKVTYENDAANLKRESQMHHFSEIRAKSCTCTANRGQVQISAIRPSGRGNPSFMDAYVPDYEWQDTGYEKLHFIHVTVYLATLSLTVPYRTQMDQSETIVLDNGQTLTKAASVICMPTCAMMLFDYWGIATISRQELMQYLYDKWDNYAGPAFANGYAPWQSWIYLNDGGRDPLAPLLLDDYERWGVGNGAAGFSPIPSPDASRLAELAARGIPTMMGTKATAGGHVLVMRGAVASADERVHWIIYNDPFGNVDLPSGRINQSGTNQDKGRHVYYNNQSAQYDAGGNFQMGPERGSLQLAPTRTLSTEELTQRITPGV